LHEHTLHVYGVWFEGKCFEIFDHVVLRSLSLFRCCERMLVACSLLPSSPSNNYYYSRPSSLLLHSKLVFLTTAMLPLFRFLLGIALVGSSSLVSNVAVEASNFSKPHAHTGKVEPFTPGDPKIKLDGKATSILRAGKPYQVSSHVCAVLTCVSWIYLLKCHSPLLHKNNNRLCISYRLKFNPAKAVDAVS
jgi:hypothetical protein